jgi:predicted dehydrogenase
MEQGKHVAIEVPAATTVDECWQLVDTAERTRRHCFMLENCCYDTFHLATLTMVERGMLGTLTHLEGAYIHDLRDKYEADGPKGWMARLCGEHKGNPYPTHGIGPVCQLLNIHRGDRLDYLVSLTPAAHVPHDVCVNNTLIRTVNGKTILLQYDVTTPRPYSRMQTVCGTRGFVQKYPRRCIMLDGQEPVKGDAVEPILAEYTNPHIARIQEEGYRLGVPNIMNYTMDRRLIECLHRGLPLDIDVYDAAEWSCIAELSERSAQNGGIPVKIPDFTRAKW